jgi:hypothetical protein
LFQRFTAAMNWISVVTAAVTGLIAIGAMLLTMPWWHSGTHRTTAHITPLRSNIVAPQIAVQGTVQNMPAGMSLWLNVEDLSNLHNNPQSGPCDVSDGTFRCAQGLVGAPNQHNDTFRLQIWLVGPDQIAVIQAYNAKAASTHQYPGMIALPDGSTLEDSLEVVRQ